jgi:hypothetical protein
MFTESTDDGSRPRSSADSAAVRESDTPRADRFSRWFKSGATLLAYRDRQQCLLCGLMRRLFIDHEGAEICYLDYEDAGFDFARAVGGK